jgi:hypothetical protein
MAHDCPECYCLCHCCGDIDDINFGESSACVHYERLECSGHREYCATPSCPCKNYVDDGDYDDYDDYSEEATA